jgi:SAM-dependent methyltransferase
LERVDKLLSAFLKRRYDLRLGLIYSKLRSVLLEEVEEVPCNLCGSDACIDIAHSDKYDLPVRSVMCRKCGLMYLNPRPTKASYDQFYTEGGSKSGVYHVSLSFDNVDALLERYYGPEFRMSEADREALQAFIREKYIEVLDRSPAGLSDEEIMQGLETKAGEFEAWRYDVYAADLYHHFKGFVPEGGKIFEVGASWGKLLMPWRDSHRCEVTGLEPRRATVRAAKERLGIDLFEGFPGTAKIPEDCYDAVMIIRTINHMIDPLGDLRHAWRWLKEGGALLIDISDAVRETAYEGFENNVVEIDHAYMFSKNTLAAMIERAGFEIAACEIVDTRHVFYGDAREPQAKQIRIVARKSLQPVAVTWPDPLQELASLFMAELAREDGMRTELAKAKAKWRAEKERLTAEAKASRRLAKAREKSRTKSVKTAAESSAKGLIKKLVAFKFGGRRVADGGER